MMSENGDYATALASLGHVDEGFNSVLDSFEVWVLFLTVCEEHEYMAEYIINCFYICWTGRCRQKKLGHFPGASFKGPWASSKVTGLWTNQGVFFFHHN